MDTVSGTTYTDTPPEVDTYYYYKIAGLNQSGVGALSGYLYAKALPILPPQTLSVSNYLYGTHIAVNWSRVSGAEKYLIGKYKQFYYTNSK